MALVRDEKARGKEKEQETVRSTIVRISKRNKHKQKRENKIKMGTKYNKKRERERNEKRKTRGFIEISKQEGATVMIS